ncbi:MAG: hypothetical protein M1818_003369 [Claussenomyces sp. TS43310]|nr:MAG: hypothetical protein M1818_003369 [Claussenomyces sp. TS43310]
MLKRKRGRHDARDTNPAQEVEARIVHAKKLLNKALKLAKIFERQKLDKRIKVAQKDEPSKVERLQKEAEVLKSLDVPTAVDAHLYKALLKTKTIAESNLLPSFVTLESKKPSVSEQEVLAISNVTARLYNAKAVKEVMGHIMGNIYAAVGVPDPAARSKETRTTASKHAAVDMSVAMRTALTATLNAAPVEHDLSEPKELGSENPSDSELDSEMESENLRYQSRIASSSEDGDDSEEEDSSHEIRKPSNSRLKTSHPRDLSITPEASIASDSPTPPPRVKKAGKPVVTKGGSTFLPTLMGGYLSGDESATDDDEVAPPSRKNRRGQQARRAIWEKKYGAKAAHVQKQAAGSAKDVHWDPKRGARSADDRRPGRARPQGMLDGGRGRTGFVRSREQVTGENAVPIVPRNRGTEKKEDGKGLHPSWIAARKAKEEKKVARFSGKKVVFD